MVYNEYNILTFKEFIDFLIYFLLARRILLRILEGIVIVGFCSCGVDIIIVHEQK